ncbi:MAG: glycosyltransferase [Candidatus Diapherotrites archaeon]|uniref:Glycosyltransferase n=1 Tax=Candidatus Iainarchaeum sp. TaxID=3101447 RepID=A0A8T3YPX7_9ARCH|nr:glycosyltransferase [Candidatus Diapherotrites archaeon]
MKDGLWVVMERLKASIVVPAYNSEATIRECISAIQNQEYGGNFEIIVIDDGSKDATALAAKRAGARVVSQENAGPAKARNLGARISKGEIIIFTDADCIPEKNWLSEMLKPFGEAEVAGVQGTYRTRQESIVARFAQIEIEERYELMEKNAGSLDWIGSYSAAYRRKDFFDAGGFDESFPKASGEDPELSYKLQKAGKKLVFNPEAAVYHTHPETLWKYLLTKFYRAFYRVNLYSKHKDKIVKDSYTTIEIRVQVVCAYAGTALFLLSLPFVYLGMETYALASIMASTAFTAVGLASGLKFTIFAARRDIGVALFSLLAIPLRTTVFTAGLVAGAISKMVKT